ncbi:MAG: Ig domain-containing protein, partial [Lachnospiraceae bacterium]|nr:Ig domain-containing protein [Lachnospiraceae bacterium]
MKKRTRRILSLFLGLVMLFAHIFPSPAVTVRAAEEPTYVYKLTDGLTDGGEYLIVSANSGTAYALRNPGGTSGGANMAATAVTLQTGDVDLDGTEDVFIADAQANEIWTATASGSGFHLTNGTDTLEGKGGSVKIYNSIQYADRYWTYQGEQLKHGGGSASNTYTLYYSNGFTSSYNSTTNTVYLYVKTQVAQGDASVTGVSVSPAQLTLKVGKSEKLTATVEPADAANKQVAWTSSNAAIASVSSDGTVTGVAAGSAVITATTADGGFTGTCAVTVEEAVLENYVLVDAFTSGKDYLIVSANEAGSAYALRNPGATSGGASMGAEAVTIVNGAIGGSGASVLHIAVEDSEALAWRATANSTGFDLTNGGGYLEGKSGNVAIYSTQQYPARYWIYSGQKLTHEGGQYPYTLYYSNGFTGSSTSSSTGNIYIYEKSDGSVQNVPVTGVTVTPAQITMKAGQARDLSAEVEPANATNKNVAWTSSNTAVATVSAAGKVTAVAAGRAVNPATTADGGFTGTCAVTVEEAALENYVLVDALTSGKDYLIVSANEAGSAYALRNPGATSGGASMAAEAVTIVNGAIGDGAAVLHIAVEDSEALAWRATANSTGFDLTNGGGYLEGKSGNV